MNCGKRLAALTAVSALCIALSSCVHYRGQSLAPAQSEIEFRQRSFNDPGLVTFVRSVSPAQAKSWPPKILDLNTATLTAAYFNPAISVARARVRTADAAIMTAGGRPNPSIGAAAGYETVASSPVVLRLELSLPIETAHKRSYRILEAAKLAGASRIALKETSWQIYSDVRNAWMDYVAALERAGTSSRESQIRASIVSLTEQRLSVGELSRPEWNQARIEASRAAAALNAIRGQVIQARLRLASVMGLPDTALSNIQLTTSEYDSPEPAEQLRIDQVQQAGLLNRLDVQRSLLEYAAADARLHLEIARQYPDVQLNPGYDFDEGFHKFTFGPSLPIPVWSRNRGPIAEAEARRSEAQAMFVALQQKAISEMQQVLAGYRTALTEYQETDTRWGAFQKDRERSLYLAVQIGEQDQLALNVTRLQSIEAEQARLDALAKTRAAFSNLENAVQAPLDEVRWIQPEADSREGKRAH